MMMMMKLATCAVAGFLVLADRAGSAAAGKGPLLPPLLSVKAARKAAPARKGNPAQKPSPAVKAPVVLHGDVTTAIMKQRRKKHTVYIVPPGATLNMDFPGPGKLVLLAHQLLPEAPFPKSKVTFNLTLGDKARTLGIAPGIFKGAKLSTARRPVSLGTRHSEEIRRSVRAVLSGADETLVLRIEFFPPKSRTPAPVTIEAQPAADRVATAEPAETASEPAVAVAPPAPAPVPEPVAPPSAASAPMREVVAAAKSESAEAALKRRVAAGEIKDALLGAFDRLTVIDTQSDERATFSRVAPQKSYRILAAGPGELSVRVHRVIAKNAATPSEGQKYSIVILENDIVLQTLGAVTARTDDWVLAGDAAKTEALSAPREYLLKVGAKHSELAFQIAGAPEGMAVRYSYKPEAMSLAAMSLDLDDDEDGAQAPAAVPTVLMEVDVSKHVAVQPTRVGLAVQVGAVMPFSGGLPAGAAGIEARVAMPFTGGRATLGVASGYQIHQLRAQVADLDGAALELKSTVAVIPILGKLGLRIALGEAVGLYIDAGAGVSHISARGEALGGESAYARWMVAVHGALGTEIDLGAGWLGLEAGYVLIPSSDFGGVLRSYSPGGVRGGVRYRIGI